MKQGEFSLLEFRKDLIFGSLAGACAKTIIAPLDRGKILFQSNSFSVLLKFALGSASGFIATTATYPLDLSRARLAVTNKEDFKNIFDIIRHTYSKFGIMSLYKGYWPTMIGIMIYSGTGFTIFEILREYNERNKSYLRTMGVGALAGVTGQLLTYPIDIIRRNYQVYDLRNKGESIKSFASLTNIIYGRNNNIMDTNNTNQTRLKRMYKAASLNLIKGPLAQGTAFSVFWALKTFFS